MGFMVVVPEGRVPTDAQAPGAFVGLSSGFGTDLYRPLILRGRAADQARADELTINAAMAALTGLEPGDEVTLASLPEAVHQPATVVGVHAGPLDVTLNSSQPLALLTPAFGAAWFEKYLDLLPTEVRSGYTTVVMAGLRGAEGRADMQAEGFINGREFGSEAIAGLDAQRTAFTALALAGAAGTLLALGQAVSRRIRRDADQLPILTALGLTPRKRQTAIAAAPCAAAVLGLAAAPFIAYFASPVVSTGVTDLLEVGRPKVVDLAVMGLGPALGLVVIAVFAWSAVSRADTLSRAPRLRPIPIRLPGPSGLFGGRVAAGWATPAARTTAQIAPDRGDRRNGGDHRCGRLGNDGRSRRLDTRTLRSHMGRHHPHRRGAVLVRSRRDHQRRGETGGKPRDRIAGRSRASRGCTIPVVRRSS